MLLRWRDDEVADALNRVSETDRRFKIRFYGDVKDFIEMAQEVKSIGS